MNEEEIRPKKLFQKYLELSRIDGEKLNFDEFKECNCQACDSSESKISINKGGYKYLTCLNCTYKSYIFPVQIYI